MARLARHAPSDVRHLRGRVGDLVYKWYGKRLVVTKVARPSTKKPTRRKKAAWNRFSLASDYAERVRYRQPGLWAVYAAIAKRRRVPTRAIAISDFLAVPKFDHVSANLMPRGRLSLAIVMNDPFPGKTVAVDVVARSADERVLARGPAQPEGGRRWGFDVQSVEDGSFVHFELTAVDRLGKETLERYVHHATTRRGS